MVHGIRIPQVTRMLTLTAHQPQMGHKNENKKSGRMPNIKWNNPETGYKK